MHAILQPDEGPSAIVLGTRVQSPSIGLEGDVSIRSSRRIRQPILSPISEATNAFLECFKKDILSRFLLIRLKVEDNRFTEVKKRHMDKVRAADFSETEGIKGETSIPRRRRFFVLCGKPRADEFNSSQNRRAQNRPETIRLRGGPFSQPVRNALDLNNTNERTDRFE